MGGKRTRDSEKKEGPITGQLSRGKIVEVAAPVGGGPGHAQRVESRRKSQERDLENTNSHQVLNQ